MVRLETPDMDHVDANALEVKDLAISTGKEGARLAVEFVTLASQFPTVSGRFAAIASDASLISAVLSQLGEFIPHREDGGRKYRILNDGGLQTVRSAAEKCKGVFYSMQYNLDRDLPSSLPRSPMETSRLFASFLEPTMDLARLDVKEAREILTLVLNVARLAYSKKLDDLGRQDKENPSDPVFLNSQNILARVIRSKVKYRQADKQGRGGMPPSDANSGPHIVGSLVEEKPISDVENAVPIPKPTVGKITTRPTQSEAVEQEGEDMTVHTRERIQETGDEARPETRKRSHPSVSASTAHDYLKEFTVDVQEAPSPVETLHRKSPATDGDKTAQSELKRRLADDASEEKERWQKPGSLRSGKSTASPSALSDKVTCLSMLGSLILSRRRENIVDDPSVHLCMTHMRPYVKFSIDGYHVGWSNLSPIAGRPEILKQLSMDQQKIKGTVTEQITRLSIIEAELIGNMLQGFARKAHLLSVSSTPVNLEMDGIKFKGVPQIRFIYSWQDRHSDRPLTSAQAKETTLKCPLVEEPLSRPTYMRISLRHIDPRTLNKYRLPWEFDRDDQSWIIVKQWLPDRDQEILFEHSRKLRIHDLAVSVPSRPLPDMSEKPLPRSAGEPQPGGKFQWRDFKQQDIQSPDFRQPRLQKPFVSSSPSFYLRVDSRNAVEKENQQADADAAAIALCDEGAQDPVLLPAGLGPLEDESDDVVNKLLARFTTLFDDRQQAKTDGDWIRL